MMNPLDCRARRCAVDPRLLSGSEHELVSEAAMLV